MIKKDKERYQDSENLPVLLMKNSMIMNTTITIQILVMATGRDLVTDSDFFMKMTLISPGPSNKVDNWTEVSEDSYPSYR